MRPVVLIGQRRPHEMCLFAAGIMLSVGYVFGPEQSTPLTQQWQWIVASMYALTFAGGVFGLIGCLWRTYSMSMGLEQTGLLLQSAGLVIYLVAVFTFAGWAAWIPLMIFSAWLLANLVRAWDIQRDVNAIRKAAARTE